jgi:predicted DNA-binding protein (MmcQ/YjbR family)/uncharacterized protein YdhG (YjbR/CyaY superfamily)
MTFFREQLLEMCAGLPGAVEDYPFGDSVAVFKVGGRMFALVPLDGTPATVNLKCDPDVAVDLRASHPAVRPGYHQNKRHWNTVELDGSLDDGELEWMIDHSYQLVVASLPRAMRTRLSGSDGPTRDRGSAATIPAHTEESMSADEVGAYLLGLEQPKRDTLEKLRATILQIVPDAEQVISYRVPAFRVRGEIVAGFAAFKDHLSYLPFSGSVLGQFADELDGYTMTKSSLHFPVDRPLPKALVKKLISARLADIDQRARPAP